jgi:hypothetical protein
MERYTVIWDRSVEESFINLWILGDSKSRETLTEIANWVDRNLSQNPADKGRPRSELDAHTAIVPLSKSTARVSVTYQVRTHDRIVYVVRLTVRGG